MNSSSIFSTYDRQTGDVIISPPRGAVPIPTGYGGNLLFQIPAPILVETSSKLESSKHPIVSNTDGYLDYNSNGRPNDIYIEKGPDFRKNYNAVIPSNYIMDSMNNTYYDGTRLSGIDMSKALQPSPLYARIGVPIAEPQQEEPQPVNLLHLAQQQIEQEPVPLEQQLPEVQQQQPVVLGENDLSLDEVIINEEPQQTELMNRLDVANNMARQAIIGRQRRQEEEKLRTFQEEELKSVENIIGSAQTTFEKPLEKLKKVQLLAILDKITNLQIGVNYQYSDRTTKGTLIDYIKDALEYSARLSEIGDFKTPRTGASQPTYN